MKKLFQATPIVVIATLLPRLSHAQDGSGLAGDISGLQSVLDQLYTEMLPLCSSLIGIGRGIAGFAALWYIAYRVWGHLSRAEPIDFYPLMRPFVIGFAIINFPLVIAMVNGVMSPTVTGTAALVQNSDAAVAALLKAKEDAVKTTDAYQMYVGATGDGDRDKWYKYTHPGEEPSDEGMLSGIGNDIRFAMAKTTYNFRNSIKEWMSQVLQVIFAAAALCINTMRTFNLLILAILGPLALGFSVFDGFQRTLHHWLSRYLNVFLWLPVANIYGALIGKIQENMLKLDISQIGQTGDTFFSPTDMGYLVFLIIAIIGYFSIPNVVGNIVFVMGGASSTGRASSVISQATTSAVSAVPAVAAAVAGRAGRGADNIAGLFAGNGKGAAENTGYGLGRGAAYMADKLRGGGTS